MKSVCGWHGLNGFSMLFVDKHPFRLYRTHISNSYSSKSWKKILQYSNRDKVTRYGDRVVWQIRYLFRATVWSHARCYKRDSVTDHNINEIPKFLLHGDPGGHPFYSQMNGGIPGNNLHKDSPPSDPYPTGRHTHTPPPEWARKWSPDHGEAIVPSVSMATPVSPCQLSLRSVKLSVSLSWTSGRTGFLLTKQTHKKNNKISISEF